MSASYRHTLRSPIEPASISTCARSRGAPGCGIDNAGSAVFIARIKRNAATAIATMARTRDLVRTRSRLPNTRQRFSAARSSPRRGWPLPCLRMTRRLHGEEEQTGWVVRQPADGEEEAEEQGVSRQRRRGRLTLMSRGGGRDHGFVRAAAINRRHLRAAGPQVRRQLAAVMDRMVVRESEVGSARLLHHPEESDDLRQPIRWQRAQLRQLGRDLLLVEGGDVTAALEAGGRLLLPFRIEVEVAVHDALDEPHVAEGEVRGELPRGA